MGISVIIAFKNTASYRQNGLFKKPWKCKEILYFQRQSPAMFYKKALLDISQNSQENTCARASFLMKLQFPGCNFIKNDTLSQDLSCEFCKICKISFFTDHLWETASISKNT